MSVTDDCSKPSANTSTVTGPPRRRPLMLKPPSASVVVLLVVPEGVWMTRTCAPLTGPVSAVTVPRTDEDVSCA